MTKYVPLKKFYVIGHEIVFVIHIQKVFGKRVTYLSSQIDTCKNTVSVSVSFFLLLSLRFWQNYFGPVELLMRLRLFLQLLSNSGRT